MKKIIFLSIILMFFSACVKNIGNGEPPYIKLQINGFNYEDSVPDTGIYNFEVIITEINEAEFSELIINEGKNQYYLNSDNLYNNNSLLFKYEPTYTVENDSVIQFIFHAKAKNSDIQTECLFNLIILSTK
ncbi:MAG: hypothetical protein JXR68_00070 [Bacteroidales bacterium]|nr:hypothetical protein [Bacteroidales bacterium]